MADERAQQCTEPGQDGRQRRRKPGARPPAPASTGAAQNWALNMLASLQLLALAAGVSARGRGRHALTACARGRPPSRTHVAPAARAARSWPQNARSSMTSSTFVTPVTTKRSWNVVLGAADSAAGSAGGPTVLRGAGAAALDPGVRVTGWTRKGEIWQAALPPAAVGVHHRHIMVAEPGSCG